MVKTTKKYKFFTIVVFNNQEYQIENEILIKYKISVGKHFSKEKWNEIVTENQYYHYDRISKNKLKKLITTHELKTFLQEKEAPTKIINELIDKYQKYKFLNDLYYVKNYIDNKKTKEGPLLIFTKLVDKGIEKELINQELNKLNELENIEQYINNKINKIKNKTKKQIRNQIKKELVNKGFNYSLSNNLVDKILTSVNIDESKIIEKEFHKIYKRHFNTKTDFELKTFIKHRLYQKGFNLDDINDIINENIK